MHVEYELLNGEKNVWIGDMDYYEWLSWMHWVGYELTWLLWMGEKWAYE